MNLKLGRIKGAAQIMVAAGAMVALGLQSTTVAAAESNQTLNVDSAVRVIKVGTEGSFAPFSYKKGEGVEGYDIDIMEAVAKEIGVKVQWVPMPFDGVIQALVTKQLDMACASMSITPERAQRVDFTVPYYTTGLTFIIRCEDKDKYPNVESLRGKKIGAQLGSVSSLKGEEFSPGKVVNFDSMSFAYIDLKGGGTEASLNDSAANEYMLRTSNIADGLCEINELMNATKIAMAVPKGNPELVQLLNQGIREIKRNGEYTKIYEKWFGNAPPAHELED